MTNTPIHDYIQALDKELAAGNTTEHTHRPVLKALFQALNPKITATNEPQHIASRVAPTAWAVVPPGTGILNIIRTKEKAEKSASTGTVRAVSVLRTRFTATAQKGTAAAYITPQVTGLR